MEKNLKDGKWFTTQNKQESFLVKIKEDDKGNLETLWLSNDHESMCLTESDSWKIDENDQIHLMTRFTYAFGDYNGPLEESIYDEEDNLIVEKMKEVIMKNSSNGFVTPEELENIWGLVVKYDFTSFESLTFNTDN